MNSDLFVRFLFRNLLFRPLPLLLFLPLLLLLDLLFIFTFAFGCLFLGLVWGAGGALPPVTPVAPVGPPVTPVAALEANIDEAAMLDKTIGLVRYIPNLPILPEISQSKEKHNFFLLILNFSQTQNFFTLKMNWFEYYSYYLL